MAKIGFKFFGATMDDKTLLIILGGAFIATWLIRKDIENTVGNVFDKVSDTVKENITVPADIAYDLRNPPGLNKQTGFYNTNYWVQRFDWEWIKTKLHPQIRAAQKGEYTHRADQKH